MDGSATKHDQWSSLTVCVSVQVDESVAPPAPPPAKKKKGKGGKKKKGPEPPPKELTFVHAHPLKECADQMNAPRLMLIEAHSRALDQTLCANAYII